MLKNSVGVEPSTAAARYFCFVGLASLFLSSLSLSFSLFFFAQSFQILLFHCYYYYSLSAWTRCSFIKRQGGCNATERNWRDSRSICNCMNNKHFVDVGNVVRSVTAKSLKIQIHLKRSWRCTSLNISIANCLFKKKKNKKTRTMRIPVPTIS